MLFFLISFYCFLALSNTSINKNQFTQISNDLKLPNTCDNSTSIFHTVLCRFYGQRQRTSLCTGGAFPINNTKIRQLIICNWAFNTFDLNLLNGLKQLYNFTIISSNITHFIGNIPANLKRLHILNFSGIHLKQISVQSIKQVKNLKFINLTNNELTNISNNFIDSLKQLKQIHLSGNQFLCTSKIWEHYSWLLNETKISDIAQLSCATKYNSLYPGKPLIAILNYIKSLREQCPEKCLCELSNLVKDINQNLIPLINVTCQNIGLTELPSSLPINTSILHVENNNITSLQPLTENKFYNNLMDLYVDNNQIESLDELEGTFWLTNFRIFSVKSNKLQLLRIYALDNALQKNKHVARLYLGKNPWICECTFTPEFQQLLLKYHTIIKHSSEVVCASNSNPVVANLPIESLSLNDLCKLEDKFQLDSIDVLNIILAFLNIFVLVKLIIDYYFYKKNGTLPWIIIKLP